MCADVERHGEADSGIQEHIVVGELRERSAIGREVHAETPRETGGQAGIDEVAARGQHRQLCDGVACGPRLTGTGQQQVLDGRSLEGAIV